MRAFQAGRRHVVKGKAKRAQAPTPVMEQDRQERLHDVSMFGGSIVGKAINKMFSNGMAKSKTKTYTKKRYPGKSRRKLYRKVPKSMMPYSIVRALKTVKQVTINPSNGPSIGVYTLKLSSAYDPMGDASATNQPLGFDQYTALYNRYVVLGWQVKLEFVTTDNTNPCVVGFCPIASATTLSTYEHYKEIAACVTKIVTPDIDKVTLHSRGSTKRFLVPKGGKLLSSDDVIGAITGDPTRVLHGHLFMSPMDNVSDPAAVTVIVTLTQLVKFFVPVIPSRSTI